MSLKPVFLADGSTLSQVPETEIRRDNVKKDSGTFAALLGFFSGQDAKANPTPEKTPSVRTPAGSHDVRFKVERNLLTEVDRSVCYGPGGKNILEEEQKIALAKDKPLPGKRKTRFDYAKAGGLSSRFESGGMGIDAIGFDSVGGTSYGKYQISSRSGTMHRFLKYLGGKAPDIAERLTAAGSPDTGGKTGAMPEAWKEIAAEQPKRFERLQHDFIFKTHYLPARKVIEEDLGLDPENYSSTLREVLWSTAVHHGPGGAIKVFRTALSKPQMSNPDNERELIGEIYKARQSLFERYERNLKESVGSRLTREAEHAVDMFEKKNARRTI